MARSILELQKRYNSSKHQNQQGGGPGARFQRASGKPKNARVTISRLLSYMKGYGRECVLGPLFKLLEASFELLVPLVVAAIIDKGIGGADNDWISKVCCGFSGLFYSFTGLALDRLYINLFETFH